jgi:hypothetical protein
MQTKLSITIVNEHVIGVRAKTPRGELEFTLTSSSAPTDGIRSFTARAGFKRRNLASPSTCLWMRISKKQAIPATLGFFQHGKLLVLLDRGDYWQCGL